MNKDSLNFVWADGKRGIKSNQNITIGSLMSIPQVVMDRIGVKDTDKIDIGFDEKNQLVGIRKGHTYKLNKQSNRIMIRTRKNIDIAKNMVGGKPEHKIQDNMIILYKKIEG